MQTEKREYHIGDNSSRDVLLTVRPNVQRRTDHPLKGFQMKHFTQIALDILVAAENAPLTISGIEKIAALAGADLDSRNCGGFWDLVLIHSGLVTPVRHNNQPALILSEHGKDIIFSGRY
jgi:hypothetical protein